MAEEPVAIMRFADSALTWGGLGVVLGCASGSPAAYKYTFWFGFLVVAIAAIRSKPFKESNTPIRVGTTALFCVGLGIVWLFLWHVIPRPAEPRPDPPTKEEIADAVIYKLGISARPAAPTNLTATVNLPRPSASSKGSSLKFSSANQIADAIVAKLPKSPELSNALLTPSVHSVSSQLREWIGERKGREEDLQNRRWLAERQLRDSGASGKERQQVDDEWVKKINDSSEVFQKKLEAMMSDADSLRQLMLQKLPQSNWTEEDKNMDKDFKGRSSDVAADYLERLVKRI